MAAHRYTCTVKSFKMLTPTVFELAIDTDQPVSLEAGQFLSIVIPGAGPNGKDLRRAYSISSPPERRPIELCVKLVEEGPGTNFLYEKRGGDTFVAYAPYGDFLYRTPPERIACFIATGTGIAPFRAFVQSRRYQECLPKKVICLMGTRTESELLYEADFLMVPGMQWIPVISRPEGAWSGFRGRVTDYVRALDQSFPWAEIDFYLCGNGAMISDMKALLLEKGVNKDAIRQEIYYK